MLIKTLLNNIEKYSSFVYKIISLGVQNDDECLIIEINSRKGSRGKCPICYKRYSTYDTARNMHYIIHLVSCRYLNLPIDLAVEP